MKRYALCVCLLLVACIPCAAQDFSAGLIPFQSYQTQGFDSVNLANLNLVLHVPVVSYPQRGQLHDLSLSLAFNSPEWFPVCDDYCYWQPLGPLGVQVVRDDLPYLGTAGVYDPGTEGYDYVNYVSDSTGGSHNMGWAATGFQSDDASGYFIGYSWNALIDRSGIQYQNANNMFAMNVQDTHGNTITANTSDGILLSWTDSIGRTITPPQSMQTTPTSAHCQTLVYPAPESATIEVTLCYSAVSISHSEDERGLAYSGTSYLLTSMTLPTGTWSFAYDSLGEVTSVTTPTGGTVTYTYAPTCDGCPNGVSTRVVNDGTNSNTWQYSYNFSTSTTTVTDPLGNVTAHVFGLNPYETETRYYQGASALLKTVDTTYSTPGSDPFGYIDGGNYIGVTLKSVTTTWPNGQVSKICTIYDDNTATLCGTDNYNPSGPTFFDGNSLSSASYPLVLGSQIEKDEYDYGAIGSNMVGSLLRQTLMQYAWQLPAIYGTGYSTENLLDRISQVAVFGNAGYSGSWSCGSLSAYSCTSYGYDAYADTNTVTRWLNPTSAALPQMLTTQMATSYTYTGYGMPATMTDSAGNTTTYSYDGTNAYLSSIQYPMPWVIPETEYFSYDSNSGLMISHTDRNSQTSTYAYQVTKQPLQFSYPDGGQTNYTYDSANTFHAAQKVDSSGTLMTTYGTVDGLGRNVVQANTNGEAVAYDRVDTCYEGNGRVSFVSYPYQSGSFGGSPGCSGTGDSYSYDALNRLLSITHSDGSMKSLSYSGSCVTIWDELANPHGECYDAAGRLTQLWEDQPGFNYPTFYQYDANDNMISVVQSSSRNRSFVYDSLSRLTSASNPESGTTTYKYDSDSTCSSPNAFSGDLVSKTDARSIRTCMQYDVLHRLTSENYTDGTPTVNLGYDYQDAWGRTLTNTVGRLVTTSTVDSTGHGQGEIFSYDPMGRVVRDEQCISAGINGCLTAYAGYNFFGSLTSFTNVEGTAFSYAYNAADRITSLTSSLSDTNHPGTLMSGMHYTALGQPTTDLLGNGVYEYYGYTSRGWVSAYWACQVMGPSCSAAEMAYTFNMTPSSGAAGYAPNGNVLYSDDWMNGNWSYNYDAVNRLTSASCASTTSSCPGTQNTLGLQFVYDAWGNRSQENVIAGSGPTSSLSFTASNNNRIDTYSYDAAGNLLSDGTNSYLYDGDNRITSADSGAISYTYDAFGRRVSKTTPAGTVNYFYDTLGRQSTVVTPSASLVRAEIYSGDRHLGTYSSTSTYFSHDDWLGIERARTDVNGNVVETCQNTPFGDFQSCMNTDISPLHFTGQERDSESNLDNFGARYYSSQFGRFMSPDPYNAGANPLDPQTWNMYSYVRNNPLTMIDPSGMDACYWDDGTHDTDPVDGGETNQQCDDQGGTWIPTLNQSITVNGDTGDSEYSADLWDTGGISLPQQSGTQSRPNLLSCAANFGSKYSLAGGLHALGIGTSGVGGFLTDALGGNSVSGISNLLTSVWSGSAGGHSVFYNMAQGVAAGPSQGIPIPGATGPWAASPSGLVTGTAAAGSFSAVTGAGQTLTTLGGEVSLASTEITAGEFASGFISGKFYVDAAIYFGGLAVCAAK